MKRTTKLRELMSTGKTVVIPGCYNAVSGKILDRVGFPASSLKIWQNEA